MVDVSGPDQPLDLSILAQVTRPSDDVPPSLPDGPEPVTAQPQEGEQPRSYRDRTIPRPDTATDPTTPPPRRPSRAGRPRGRETESPRAVVRDEHATEYRPGVLVRPLTELYTAMGTMLMPFNQPVGTAIIQNAQPCAESLDNLARTNPQVRKALMSLLQTGAWGQVIAAHMPIMLALAVTLSPSVRRAMEGPPPDADTNETVNPMSNGYGPRQ